MCIYYIHQISDGRLARQVHFSQLQLGQQVSKVRVGWQQGEASQHVVRMVVASRAHVEGEGGVGLSGCSGRAQLVGKETHRE